MASVTSSITINQPVEKVFGFLIDVNNHKAWQPALSEAKVTPDGPIGVGSTYQYVTEVMGQRIPSAMQVSIFEENKTWAVKTTGTPNPVQTVYSFESTGGQTQMTISMELSGGFPAAAEGMIKAQMQKSLEDQCQSIKQIVGG